MLKFTKCDICPMEWLKFIPQSNDDFQKTLLETSQKIINGKDPKISEFSVVGDYNFVANAQNIKEFENKLGITHICLPWEENE